MFLSSCIALSGESNPKIIISCIIIIITILVIILYKIHNSKPSKNIYVVNIACFKPKKCQQITREGIIKRTIQCINQTSFTEETLKTLMKMTNSTGLGDSTYIPETLLRDPPDLLSLAGARQDAQAAIFGAVDTLLRVTRVDASSIGVVVVNSSVFTPLPSLSSMIVNKYKLKDDVKSYCLSGMGCSAGIVAVDLASQLLQVHPNTYAMIVSTDVLGQNYYTGNDPYKLGINCLMRVGGAAILLSNHSSDHGSSKYQLMHAVRTNTSSSDNSYHSIFQDEDEQGHVGIAVSKHFLIAAKTTIKTHFTALGPKILPMSEQLKFIMNKFMYSSSRMKSYLPNFGLSVDHFIPHVGSKSVLDVVEMTLKVNIEAARMTLYRFGNSSSTSIWYGLAYNEAKGKVKKGDRVWVMGLGSGFKCNSLIWKAIKDVDDHEEHNPWSQEIDEFPIELEISMNVASSNLFSFLDNYN